MEVEEVGRKFKGEVLTLEDECRRLGNIKMYMQKVIVYSYKS